MAIWLYQTLLCLWCSLSHELLWLIFLLWAASARSLLSQGTVGYNRKNTNGARSLLFHLFPSTLEMDVFSQQFVSGFIKISVEHICFSSPSRAKVWNSRFWFLWLVILNHANSSCKDRAAHSRLSTIGTWYLFSICNLGQPYTCAWEQTGSWCQGGTT